MLPGLIARGVRPENALGRCYIHDVIDEAGSIARAAGEVSDSHVDDVDAHLDDPVDAVGELDFGIEVEQVKRRVWRDFMDDLRDARAVDHAVRGDVPVFAARMYLYGVWQL